MPDPTKRNRDQDSYGAYIYQEQCQMLLYRFSANAILRTNTLNVGRGRRMTHFQTLSAAPRF